MLQNKLKVLQSIDVDAAQKEQDVKKIENRLKRKAVPWQIPTVVTAMVCLIFFLLVVTPKSDQIASTEQKGQAITAIYQVMDKGNPSSALQLFVDNFTDPGVLKDAQNWLENLKSVELVEEKRVPTNINYTFRLNFANGESRVFYQMYRGQTEYYFDITTKQYYTVATNEPGLLAIVTGDSYFNNDPNDLRWIFVFAVWILIYIIIQHYLRKGEDKNNKPPMHSTYWQSIAVLMMFVLLVAAMLLHPHLHYFVVLVIIAITTVLNIVLESRHGQSQVRKISFVLNAVTSALYLYCFLWVVQ